MTEHTCTKPTDGKPCGKPARFKAVTPAFELDGKTVPEETAYSCAGHTEEFYEEFGDGMSKIEIIPIIGQKYRHLKRGTVYEVIHEGLIQNKKVEHLNEDDNWIIYKPVVDDDGTVYIRHATEFLDGRFELVRE